MVDEVSFEPHTPQNLESIRSQILTTLEVKRECRVKPYTIQAKFSIPDLLIPVQRAFAQKLAFAQCTNKKPIAQNLKAALTFVHLTIQEVTK